jgi:nucleotide-binding universal stress UspA family protein
MAAARRLLVGFDGSPPAVAALARAMGIARRNHGALTVALVLQTSFWSACPLAPILPLACDFEQAAIDELRSAVDNLAPDISVVSVVCRGPIGPALARTAARCGCDTIVIGRHRAPWRRLTGGVEGYLRRHAKARLIVVPARASRRRGTRRANALGGAAPGASATARARPA